MRWWCWKIFRRRVYQLITWAADAEVAKRRKSTYYKTIPSGYHWFEYLTMHFLNKLLRTRFWCLLLRQEINSVDGETGCLSVVTDSWRDDGSDHVKEREDDDDVVDSCCRLKWKIARTFSFQIQFVSLSSSLPRMIHATIGKQSIFDDWLGDDEQIHCRRRRRQYFKRIFRETSGPCSLKVKGGQFTNTKN